ncbi:MAG: 16S rRNA (cytidine(1402)-2'-O)-methyltransferase [Magnetococcales bacterium]|nr:16S rRNA (cytidine(1402)-2'-O)-methyltransferase [Magnetococcales bacterium]
MNRSADQTGQSRQADHLGQSGKVYIVPTPIGNLEDMTFRAVRVLQEVDLILAEDTRRTGILCQRYGIETEKRSFHAHNEHQRQASVLKMVQEGRQVALVSDAGMPLVSDPGAELVRAIVAEGGDVEVLPGASAAITALVGSGLAGGRFAFGGFVGRSRSARRQDLLRLDGIDGALIFYESPKRLASFLGDAAESLGGERPAVVARELSKAYETWHRGTLSSLQALFENQPPRGEVVVVIGRSNRQGPALLPVEDVEESRSPEASARERIAEMISDGVRVREIARVVARESALPKKRLYAMALEMSKRSEE